MPVSLIELLFQLLVYDRSEEDTPDISIMGALIGNCTCHLELSKEGDTNEKYED